MSKKVILSTLLASAAILGVSATTHAATSDIKAESKKVTVSVDKAKLYKDSKMKESSTPKKGTVYQVDGYRNIDGKHVYRVYQNNADNEKTYKGYIVDKDTKELKSSKASGQYVAKKGATMWNNFYWNNKKSVTNEEKVFFAKYSYTLGDGAKYFSVYYKDKDGKDVWAGYTNASNVKELKATEETKYVTLKKDYSTWSNLYFKQHKDDFKASKGVNFKVKRYYTLNGNKFYSTYRTDSNGDEIWTGYVNGYSSVIEDLKSEAVKKEDQAVQVTKDYNTYKNHFFNKKGQVKAGENVKAVRYYTYGNSKRYASIENEKGEWLGYVNVDAIQSTKDMNEALPAAKEAIEKAQAILDKAQASKETKAEAQKVIDEAKKLVENPKVTNTESIKNIPHQIQRAMELLKGAATSADIQSLENALKDAKEVVANEKDYNLTNVKAVSDAMAKGQTVLADAKDGKASSEDVDNAVKAINDAIAKVGFDKETIEKTVETLKETEANVYLTKAQEDELKSKVTEALGKVEGTTATDAEDAKAALDMMTEAISAMNENQPNKEDGTALDTAVDKAKELEEYSNGHGADLFTGYDEVSSKEDAADKILTELKKDQKDNNQATEEETKEQVEKATSDLDKALQDLSVNMSSVTNYERAVHTAIKELDEENKNKAQDALASFDATIEHNGNLDKADDYQRIINAAKTLNDTIHNAQKEELTEAVDKAKEIAGDDNANKKFYEDSSYTRFNNAKEKAETLLGKFDDKNSKPDDYVTEGKEAAEDEKAIETAITKLDVKDWEEKDENGNVVLTKYTGDYTSTASTSAAAKEDEAIIEVPGMLKGEQVVLDNDGSESDKQLFPEKKGAGKATVKFEEANGHKVKAGDSLYAAMYFNQIIKDVDFAGLDTSDVTNFRSMFGSATHLSNLQNSQNLVTAKATNLQGMFQLAWDIETIDASNWNTKNVTDMSKMFRGTNVKEIKGIKDWNVSSVTDFNEMFAGTNQLATLDLSGWNMEKATKENTKDMFVSTGVPQVSLHEITLPNEFNGSNTSDKYVAEAVVEAGKKKALGYDVTVKDAQGKKLGTVKKDGKWESEGSSSSSSETSTTTEK